MNYGSSLSVGMCAPQEASALGTAPKRGFRLAGPSQTKLERGIEGCQV